MNINIKDVLTLDDGIEYVVVSKVSYENKEYLYLNDLNNNSNLKICYLENDELIFSDNEELNAKLLPLFYDAAKDNI